MLAVEVDFLEHGLEARHQGRSTASIRRGLVLGRANGGSSIFFSLISLFVAGLSCAETTLKVALQVAHVRVRGVVGLALRARMLEVGQQFLLERRHCRDWPRYRW